MHDFVKIKNDTRGFLNAEVYQALYGYAVKLQSGVIVDIGPAQGGSTICFGLASKENDKIGKIYSIDKFIHSAALAYFGSVEKNVKVLRDNLERYSCSDKVEILVFGQDDINKIMKEPISFLFIDADGALDRDMLYYYNALTQGGIVVVDDNSCRLNIQTTSRSLKWQFESQVDNFIRFMDAPDLLHYTPLGKHYTTYRFLEYLLEKEFLIIEKKYGDTVFLRKSEKNIEFTENNYNEMQEIRRDIVELFTDSRLYVRKIFNKLLLHIKVLAKQIETKDILVYEYSYYKIKNQKQFNKVYEWHEDGKKYFDNDIKIQNVFSEEIEFVYNSIKNGRIFNSMLSEQKNKLDKFLYEIGYENAKYIPIVNNEELLGFIIALEPQNVNNKIDMERFNLCFKEIQRTVNLFFEVLQRIM